MPIREIPRDQWALFLDHFSRTHMGRPVSLESFAGSAGAHVEALHLPLRQVGLVQMIEPDRAAASEDDRAQIEIVVDDEPPRVIRAPAALRVEWLDDGTLDALRIDSTDGGPTTVLRFEPEAPARERPSAGPVQERSVRVTTDALILDGDLALPPRAEGVVLFAHGEGSDRFSPRNRYVARRLREAGFGTLLVDLLTREEEHIDFHTHQYGLDVDLLAGRISSAIGWLARDRETAGLPVGLYGAGTGGAAALVAAAEHAERIRAVVCRSARTDLARSSLAQVCAPTLLVVGSRDEEILAFNRETMTELLTEKKLEVIPGATRLFPEAGALRQLGRVARAWFERHMVAAREPASAGH
ncbi:MAG: DUF5335 family protein [Deltaproteobacteria bacterium]|nr:DUF5335 family protein [Deltaproteobacteria bacterium]